MICLTTNICITNNDYIISVTTDHQQIWRRPHTTRNTNENVSVIVTIMQSLFVGLLGSIIIDAINIGAIYITTVNISGIDIVKINIGKIDIGAIDPDAKDISEKISAQLVLPQ